MSRVLAHYKNTTLCENWKNSDSRSIFLLILKEMPKRYSPKYIHHYLVVTCLCLVGQQYFYCYIISMTMIYNDFRRSWEISIKSSVFLSINVIAKFPFFRLTSSLQQF